MPASPAPAVTRTSGGLTATAHLGDRSCLLAFDVPAAKTKDLAGFAVRVTPQGSRSGTRASCPRTVEAIRLFDHYRFRSRQSKATKAKPLGLHEDDAWTAPFYDPKEVRYREREVFVQA